jgi:hypothetical protein
MKQTLSLLTLLLFTLTTTAFAQRTLIADNSGNPPEGDHVFPSLQAAIDAAVAGDIIHVVATGLSHGEVTISGKTDLEIYGAGFNPSLSAGALGKRSYVDDMIIKVSTDIKISGIEVLDDFFIQVESGVLSEDIILEKIYIRDALNIDGGRNVLVKKSLFRRLFAEDGSISQYADIVFTNNIISGNSFDGFQAQNALFTNNLIHGNSWINYFNCVFINNIISGTFRGTPTGNSFNTNLMSIEFGIGDNGNIGSNNVVKAFTLSQLFIDINIGTGTWDRFWDPTPKSEDVIGKATDGGDLGPTGGSDPYQLTSFSLPAITEFLAPTSVKKGNTFEVTIKAKGN